MENNLSEKLFFSKEAAEYLNITTQRLNTLVKEGKISPLKKNSSGTIFYIDELNKRKEEQKIFEEIKERRGLEMFDFDNANKREALNFATLMNVLNVTEHKLDPIFSDFSNICDVTIFLDDPRVTNKYVQHFKIDETFLLSEFKKARKAFLNLKEDDEIIKRGDEDYPALLFKTKQAPRFLYLRGNKSLLLEDRTVALVGSRVASEKAKQNTKRLAAKLGKNGITIISGLAKGIDVTAHEAALDNKFNTIAVIGTNLNQYYPAENKIIQQRIEKEGLVVSQFSPANKTERWFFPLRNGVMSGLSLATIIMEAGETSGALKQADYALKQNREVMIPKSALDMPSISWPAKYIKKGARVVETPKDVLINLAESNIYKFENGSVEEQTNINDYLAKEKSIEIQTTIMQLLPNEE